MLKNKLQKLLKKFLNKTFAIVCIINLKLKIIVSCSVFRHLRQLYDRSSTFLHLWSSPCVTAHTRSPFERIG